MTIAEAALEVLKAEDRGLTCREITNKILENGLYEFHTDNPCSMVNEAIRRRCKGLDFSTAHQVKFFKIVSGKQSKTKYQTLEYTSDIIPESPYDLQRGISDHDMLPVEKMQKYYDQYISDLQKQLLQKIMANDPAFFEGLVVEMLLRLGYGYGEDAGRVVGRSHDGGIDGVINEDKLGLDKIYIQAKRYDRKHKVGIDDIRAFAGAMIGVNKGVFITTSSFTGEAVKYVEAQHEKRISLVDGPMLSELMVKCGVGIRVIQSFDIYEIDPDLFGF